MQSSIQHINVSDSEIIIFGTKLSLKSFENCKQLNTDSAKEEEFLNNNIQYYYCDTLVPSLLNTEIFYRTILKTTHFLEFEESSFRQENFTFSVIHKSINNYGTCIIGKYYFSSASNSAQRRATIIINPQKKEISIWNFEDIKIDKEGLICDFNVRGRHSFYKLSYSIDCKKFR